MAAAGIALAYYMYMFRTELPALLAARLRPVYLLLLNKWYFDEFYDRLLVRPAHYLGRELWREGDGSLIDGLGPDGLTAVARNLAERASRLQTGYVYHYAFAMMIGVASAPILSKLFPPRYAGSTLQRTEERIASPDSRDD